jgi:hypothetical protein
MVGYSGVTAASSGYTGSAPVASGATTEPVSVLDFSETLDGNDQSLQPVDPRDSSVTALVQEFSDLEIDGLLEGIVDGRVMNDQHSADGFGLEKPLLDERRRRQEQYLKEIDEYPVGLLSEDELRKAVGSLGGQLSDSHMVGDAFARGFSSGLKRLEPALQAYALVQGMRGVPKTYSGLPRPHVENSELRRLVDELYRKQSTFGNGGTADAVWYEVRTGYRVGGKSHIQKAFERIGQLEKWIARNYGGGASTNDLRVANELRADLQTALAGDPKRIFGVGR